MKNLGVGKSSKLVLKIMKHVTNHALAGQLAELGVQVVQYLAEIEVAPFPLKALLGAPLAQRKHPSQISPYYMVVRSRCHRFVLYCKIQVRLRSYQSYLLGRPYLLLLCFPPIFQNFRQHFLLQTK